MQIRNCVCDLLLVDRGGHCDVYIKSDNEEAQASPCDHQWAVFTDYKLLQTITSAMSFGIVSLNFYVETLNVLTVLSPQPASL